jgi:hypothetical protein
VYPRHAAPRKGCVKICLRRAGRWSPCTLGAHAGRGTISVAARCTALCCSPHTVVGVRPGQSADHGRNHTTGDARGIIPLARRRHTPPIQRLPPAGREMISLHPRCARMARPSLGCGALCCPVLLPPPYGRRRTPRTVSRPRQKSRNGGCKGNQSPCPSET